jgi:hypothetical protein
MQVNTSIHDLAKEDQTNLLMSQRTYQIVSIGQMDLMEGVEKIL